MTREEAFKAYIRTGLVTPELRAAGEGTNSAGGFTVAPEFHASLTVQLQAFGALFRNFTRFETEHGSPMFAPSANFASAGVVQAEDSGPVSANDRVYGQTAFPLTPTLASGMHQVSIQFVTDSAFPVEDVISAYAAESIGRKLATLSVSGTGSGQPFGVIPVANAQGAWSAGNSGGFISLTAAAPIEINGAATTELVAGVPNSASLLKMVQAVDPAYYDPDPDGSGGAKWFMNGAQYTALCSITDTTGQPIMRPNGPRVLHGFPITIANELPNLTASTTGGVVFGNLSKAFYYRDAGFEVKRLNQRYADNLQVGFLGWHRADFQARDARAFVTVKPAAT
ncbi:phage major capsid protein [Trebonia kvetii]|uniref:Phage major capsid protein n=1 Tax=Trebonia kvetii TaxID=2480626 RepID=A0A6P2C0J4_9ACTN|nr:phage major capsid protein [Trebonia kvetii]TVZ04006.1 phage major capsid protein [Trebonia kvetii]